MRLSLSLSLPSQVPRALLIDGTTAAATTCETIGRAGSAWRVQLPTARDAVTLQAVCCGSRDTAPTAHDHSRDGSKALCVVCLCVSVFLCGWMDGSIDGQTAGAARDLSLPLMSRCIFVAIFRLQTVNLSSLSRPLLW